MQDLTPQTYLLCIIFAVMLIAIITVIIVAVKKQDWRGARAWCLVLIVFIAMLGIPAYIPHP
jgi:hypothetical protein